MGIWTPGPGATSGDDVFTGDGTGETADGLAGNDTLNGNGGADTLDGGAGIDVLHGGDGDDTLTVSTGSLASGDQFWGDDGVDELYLTSTSTISAAFDLRQTYIDHIERIVFAANDAAFTRVDISGEQIGPALLPSNTIVQGSASQDSLVVNSIGGETISLAGFIFLDWNDDDDSVFIDGFTTGDSLTGSQVDDLIRGLDGADTLSGASGDDTLDGGLGADTMAGGAGDDVYLVEDAGDITSEVSPAGGSDTVQSSVTRNLTANIENLTLTGVDAITGYGNGIDNDITGNFAANSLYGFDGNDRLDGAGGADSMFGGNGDDTYYVDNSGDITSEVSVAGGLDLVISFVTRNLTTNIENLTLAGGGAINGSGNIMNNFISGNGGANTLYGFDGNDRLDGGLGADTLFGANGDDVYVVDNVNDITVEGSPAGGTDTVESSISRNLNANFENLTLLGSAQFGYGNVLDNIMTGNAASNALYGFDGGDTLDGGAGADQMFGGNGDDVYVVDNAGDITSEVSAGGGSDTVESAVTRNLTANLEHLVLTGAGAINGAGNALNNIIFGNAAANTLYGLDGADTLDGGLGADTLQGGAGADEYVFSFALGAGNIDAIVGFNVADDTIELAGGVFTGLAVGGLDADAFHIGATAADAEDRIVYNSATGALSFDADGSGGGAAVLFATLTAGLALTNSDFIVSGP